MRKQLEMSDSTRWYMVGLVATDGCLSSDGRHVSITAKDGEFLEALHKEARLFGKVGIKNKGKLNQAHHIQISNTNFYEFLVSKGIFPKKSLTLKSIDVPEEYFSDFCRGVIDGDGSIRKWKHPHNKSEQWSLRIYSASKDFICWIKTKIEETYGASGRIYTAKRIDRNEAHTLKFGKMAAVKILQNCYYQNALTLNRKAKLAQECCSSRMGWTKSKTTAFAVGRVAE
jgi:hypothetical protein